MKSMPSLKLSLLVVSIIARIISGAPHNGDLFTLKQPDGTEVDVQVWGDEFFQHVEGLDGYTVVRDSATNKICYAEVSADGKRLAAKNLEYKLRKNALPDQAYQARVKALNLKKKSRLSQEAVRIHAKAKRRELAIMAEGDTGSDISVIQSSSPQSGVLTGAVLGLTLLIDFSDCPATMPRAEIESYLNQIGYSNYSNNGSVRDYYRAASGNQLDYTNYATEYYRAIHPKTYYTDPSVSFGSRARELIREALLYFDNQGFNYSTLSVNGYGQIRAINAFYAGNADNAWSAGLWPHMWYLSPTFTADGVSSMYYQITNIGTSLRLRTFCHENGHMLFNWDDLYDYGYQSYGAGNYCLMAYGASNTNPIPPNPYFRSLAGWENLITLTAGTVLSHTANSMNTYKYSNPSNSKEYFLIESRTKTGRNASIPDDGLLVWHIDQDGSNDYEQRTADMHYQVSVEQADGLFDLETDVNAGGAGDLFHAGYKDKFDDYTVPQARWWNGSNSKLDIVGIGAVGATMTFTMPAANFSSASQTKYENGGSATITVQITAPTNHAISIPYTVSGTASYPADHNLANGTFSIAAGQTTASKTIALVNDAIVETNETIIITLGSSATVHSGTILQHQITIIDDDANNPPVVKAGKDTSILFESLLVLGGTVTDDGRMLATPVISWTKVSGPGLTQFTPANAAQTTVSFSAPGVYALQLSANDGNYVVKDTVLVTVTGHAYGLAGYWRFEEGSGAIAINGAGTSNNGQIVGTVFRSPDIAGSLSGGSAKSLKLGVSGGHVKVDGVALHESFTAALWLKSDSAQSITSARILDYGDRRLLLMLSSGKLVSYVKNSSGVSYGTAAFIYPAGWHHIAAVLDADTLGLYMDGIMMQSVVKTGGLSAVNSQLYIGAENGSYPVNGLVDEVRLYSRALSDIEITSLFEGNGSENFAPQLDAGIDQELVDVLIPATAILQGGAQDDRTPVVELAAQWRQVSGPSGTIFSSPTELTTNIEFIAGGTYNLELSVSDGLKTSYDTVRIVVNEAIFDLSQGLAGNWQFDEVDGPVAVDGSGNGSHGEIQMVANRISDVPAALASQSSQSLRLGQGGGFVKIDGVGLHDNYTVTFWLKADSVQGTTTSKIFDYGDRRLMMMFSGGRLSCYMTNTAGVSFSTSYFALTPGWHHIAAVLQSDTLRLHVDNIPVRSRIKAGSLKVTDDMVYIGAEDGAYPINALVDDVRMYSRSLGSVEIEALYVGRGMYNAEPQVAAGSDIYLQNVLIPAALTLDCKAYDDRKSVSQLTVLWKKLTGPSMAFSSTSVLNPIVTFNAAGIFKLECSANDGLNKGYDTILVTAGEAIFNLADGLVGNWQFDESDGSAAIDGSGKNRNGTIAGVANRISDVPEALVSQSGKSLKLGVSGGHVKVAGTGFHDSYTVALWLKADSLQTTTSTRVFDYGDRRLMLSLSAGNLRAYTKNSSDVTYATSTLDMPAGWHHIAVTLLGDTVRLFVDKEQVRSRIKTGSLKVTDDLVYIGAENGTYPVNALVDDVRMYSRALSGVEIEALYAGRGMNNSAPQVSTGADRNLLNVLIPATITLEGTASDDCTDPAQFVTLWRRIAGPTNVAIGTSSALTTAVTFNAAGAYDFELSVNDGLKKGYDTIRVTVTEAAVNLVDGLIGNWQFDEVEGMVAIDGSGSRNNGAIQNEANRIAEVPAVLASQSSHSLKLGASGGFVKIAGVGLHDNYTVALWLKADSLQTTTSTQAFDYGDRRLMLSLSAGKLRAYIKNSSDVTYGTSGLDMPAGWHHIAVTLLGDTLRLFVDKEQVRSRIKTGSLKVTDDLVNIGAENGTCPVNALVDDVRMYSRALSCVEIEALYVGRGMYNAAPQAYAGGDVVLTDVLLPATLALSGKSYDDRKATSQLTVLWRKLAGPAMTFSSTSSLNTIATFSAAGTFSIELSAYDGQKKGYDTVQVAVTQAMFNLSEGLVGNWLFEETDGTAALDVSGNNKNGTIVGTVMRSSETPGALAAQSTKSLKLGESGGHVKVGNIGLHDNYTISLWIKADALQSTTSTRIFDYGNRRCMMWIYGGRLRAFIVNSAGTTFSTLYITIPEGWNHIAAALEGDTLRLFLNGALVSSRVKTGELIGGDDLVYIGAEDGRYMLNGLVDEVRMYSRALTEIEVSALSLGRRSGPLGVALNEDPSLLNAPVADTISGPIDLSVLIPWGGNPAGRSAFQKDSIEGKMCTFLTGDAIANGGHDSVPYLRSFTAMDYTFARPIAHDSEAIVIEFDALWDSASLSRDSSRFSVILLDNYPQYGISGENVSDFNGNPYGTPALRMQLRPGADSPSYLSYGGADGGRFDTYDYRWWLPGSVSNTDGCEYTEPGRGLEYPFSSWKSAARTAVTGGWAKYQYRILPDRQELLRNDTLLGRMYLPWSSIAPGYTYHRDFSALRLSWDGKEQCSIANVKITVMRDTEITNLAPEICFVAPLTDTLITENGSIGIFAEASDDDGNLDRVEFYIDDEPLQTFYEAPFEYCWYPIAPGEHTVRALAIDTKNCVSAAQMIKVTGAVTVP